MRARPAAHARFWRWRNPALRALVYQVLLVLLVFAVLGFLAYNTAHNMQARGIKSGFDFLFDPTGFDIGESLMPFDSAQPYWQAFLVGLSNTLRVAILGIVLATVLALFLAVGRLSRSPLVRGLCRAYVELFRNVPLLLQLLMWYLLFNETLPLASEPLRWGPLFLSKSGLSFPIPVWHVGHAWALGGALVGALLWWWVARRAQQQFERTGQTSPVGTWGAVLVPLCMLLGWWWGGAPSTWNWPEQGEFAVEHGGALTPEFLTVLIGLIAYTAAFMAEVIRAGLQALPQGQSEAATALGLPRLLQLRLVLLPQALRVIIPPLTNQYLSLTKNSSLAVAIGYPDVVSIANTALNQTGRALECILVIMAVYLSTSLLTSVLMNLYNRRAALHER